MTHCTISGCSINKNVSLFMFLMIYLLLNKVCHVAGPMWYNNIRVHLMFSIIHRSLLVCINLPSIQQPLKNMNAPIDTVFWFMKTNKPPHNIQGSTHGVCGVCTCMCVCVHVCVCMCVCCVCFYERTDFILLQYLLETHLLPASAPRLV